MSRAAQLDLTFNVAVKWLLTWMSPRLALRTVRHHQERGKDSFIRMRLAPIPEPGWVADREDEAKPKNHGPEPCPVCGQAGAQEWLRAPDRLHGRQEKYTLVRCPACSLVWLSNPPKPAEMHLHYTDAYHKLISAAGENSPDRWRDRKAGADATQAVRSASRPGLQLGIVPGVYEGRLLEALWNRDVRRVCENSRRARAERRCLWEISWMRPSRRESFDVITCFDVLEHLYEPRQVMARVGEWLKPGGIFYVLVPNVDSAEARVFGSYWHGLELPRHLFHYSPASLKFLAESAGLREVSLETRRNPAVGTSLRYVWDDVFGAVGIRRTPVAYRGEASLPWRAARKVVRMTVLRALLAMAPLVGGGESIHAIFRKEKASA